MRRRMPRAAVLVTCAPLAVAALATVVMVLVGERRILQVSAPLWAVVLGIGVGVSGLVAVVVVAQERRRRLVAEVADARTAGAAAGAAQAEARAQEARRLFLARLDHELKNPLTAIRATAAGRDGEDWALVERQAGRLSDVVRELRKLAELETRPLEREPVDLESLVRESVEALVQQHPDLAARLRFDVMTVPWSVPPVPVDLDLLSLALDNVLGNAVKYSATGPIEVRLREDAGWAVVEVADSGRGVPEADLPRVFGELARGANAHDVAGSGLGLALVSIVMSRHGGEVSMRSAEGVGTAVTLRLPVT